MTDPADHSTDEHVVDESESTRKVAHGEGPLGRREDVQCRRRPPPIGAPPTSTACPIDEAKPVFWEARTY
ncbi:hypothetical protein [Halalkalicoccus ordinarius]|uniref:hypothetical protein n=1 Tax=Halalkalicoccus ordinarius TaxID=3116651 RepID=UPI00300EAB0E